MFWKKAKFPVLFCLLFSLINTINIGLINTENTINADFKLVLAWLIGFFILIIFWFVNQIILDARGWNKRYPVISRAGTLFVFNAICIGLIFWVNFNIIRLPFYHFEQWAYVIYFIVRISTAIAIIIAVQNTLKSLSEKDAIKLANEQLRNENLQARFETLKQQINPHFLFNAFNTLRIMVREQDPNSEEFILKLSEIYRELLSKNDLLFIKLDEELHFLNAYLFLIKSRFQEMINLDINIPEQSMLLYIPTFSLQLLLENCIKHNIISMVTPLFIMIWQENPDEISIENNLQPKLQARGPSGVGLNNIKKRYELHGVENGINIFPTENSFKVILKLLKL